MGLHNIGVLVNNERYKIYRSAELGLDGLPYLVDYLEKRDLPFPKTIIHMNHQGYAFPLYFAIHEYKAQAKYGFNYYHPFGDLRTYLDGEDPYHPTDIIDKFRILGPIGRRYFNYGDGKVAGGIDALLKILGLILDAEKQPVLFHCYGGIHRTGMIAMLVRYLQGWDEKRIVNEYHVFNPVLPREKNIDFVQRFSKDPRFLSLKDRYGKLLTDPSIEKMVH